MAAGSIALGGRSNQPVPLPVIGAKLVLAWCILYGVLFCGLLLWPECLPVGGALLRLLVRCLDGGVAALQLVQTVKALHKFVGKGLVELINPAALGESPLRRYSGRLSVRMTISPSLKRCPRLPTSLAKSASR
jgi:hypothetical protein